MRHLVRIAILVIAGLLVAGLSVSAAADSLPIVSDRIAAEDGSRLHLPYVQRGWREYPVEAERHAWRYLTPTNRANDVAVDPATGLVWAATDGGLVRWDPDTGRVVRHTTQPTRRVAVDTEGNVWTASGAVAGLAGDTSFVGRLELDGTWRTFSRADGMASGVLADIVTGSRGDVWLGFGTTWPDGDRDGGLVRYTAGEGFTTFGVQQGWPSQDVLGMASDRHGGVWVTLADDGFGDPCYVGHVDRAGRATWTVLHELGMPMTIVSAVGPDGSVYARTHVESRAREVPLAFRRGLDGTWTPIDIPHRYARHSVSHIAAGDDGTTWFVVDTHLLRLSHDGAWSEYTSCLGTPAIGGQAELALIAQGVEASAGCSITFGPDGRTWIAMQSGWSTGLATVDRHGQWQTYGDPSGSWPGHVAVLTLDGDDRPWFIEQPWEDGTPHGALHLGELGSIPRKQSSGWDSEGSLQPNPVAMDQDGWIWTAGSQHARVMRTSGDLKHRTKIGVEDGLVLSTAQAIQVAPSGKVWVGGRGGASRRERDGTWTTFTMADGLPTDLVTAIAFGSDGSTWLGSSTSSYLDVQSGERVRLSAGVSRISPTGNVTAYRHEPISNLMITALTVSDTNDVWVGTERGAYVLDPTGGWRGAEVPGIRAQTRVTALAVDGRGRVWLGTDDKSVSGCKIDGARLMVRDEDGSWFIPDPSLIGSGGYVSDIEIDEAGDVWAAATDMDVSRLHRFSVDGRVSSQVLSPSTPYDSSRVSSVGKLALDGQGRVLCRLGRRTGKVVRRELDGSFTVMILDDSVPAREVVDVQSDGEGAVWAATWDGLGRWTSDDGWRTYHTANGLLDGSVSMVEADANGDIWVGYRPAWDSRGQRWQPVGATQISADGGTTHHESSDGLNAVGVRDADTDRDGVIWLATYGLDNTPGAAPRHDSEVWRRNADGTWMLVHEVGGVPSDAVAHVEVDADGTVWFGTSGNGLVWLTTDGAWHTDTERPEILALRRDRDGVVWAGTGNGAVRLSADGVTDEWTIDDGLSANRVLDIAFDSMGRPWFATAYGGVSTLMEPVTE